ncbi:Homeodomain-like protein [Melampsora americana]|nr:Homeodomain-like protein [Melampsora americana]
MYGQNWQAVANHCGRSSNQCINRWSKTLRPDIKKGKWDANEDEALRNAVAACGMVWKDVAPRVRGRTDAQCRERWCNILDPRIVVGNWTSEEDEKILRLRNQESKTWSEISKSFNGRRTDNHCMRRYSELTKSDPKRKQKNVKSHPSKFSRVIQLNPTGTHKNSLIDRIQPELLLASSSSHHHHSSSNSSNSHHLNSHKNKALISSRSCSCSSHVSCSHKSSNPLGLGLGLGHGPSTGLKRVRDLVGEEGMKGSVLKKTR